MFSPYLPDGMPAAASRCTGVLPSLPTWEKKLWLAMSLLCCTAAVSRLPFSARLPQPAWARTWLMYPINSAAAAPSLFSGGGLGANTGGGAGSGAGEPTTCTGADAPLVVGAPTVEDVAELGLLVALVVGVVDDGVLVADGLLLAVMETEVPVWLLSPMTSTGTADGAPSMRYPVADNRSATIVLPVITAPSSAAASIARKGDLPRGNACTERNRTTIKVTIIGPDGIDWASFRHHNGVADGGDEGTVRLTAWVHGIVQGVGFRWWTRCRALELGLVGSARNLSDGRVEVVAEGSRAGCERLLAALRSDATPGQVRTVVDRWTDAQGGLRGFVTR